MYADERECMCAHVMTYMLKVMWSARRFACKWRVFSHQTRPVRQEIIFSLFSLFLFFVHRKVVVFYIERWRNDQKDQKCSEVIKVGSAHVHAHHHHLCACEHVQLKTFRFVQLRSVAFTSSCLQGWEAYQQTMQVWNGVIDHMRAQDDKSITEMTRIVSLGSINFCSDLITFVHFCQKWSELAEMIKTITFCINTV